MYKHIDYYKTLQVHHDAGQDIIDAAYRCLSKIYHPDINKSPLAVENMKSINIAYGVIGDVRKRREYHTEWLRSNLNKTGMMSQPRAMHNTNVNSNTNVNMNVNTNVNTNTSNSNNGKNTIDEKNQIELAYKVLDEFFRNTVNEEWENAYQKLTLIDKKNIPMEDFLEWKKSVAQMYKLGNYKISYFRKYSNCDYAGAIYPDIMQFSVNLTEMQIVTGQISEENTQKYVAFDKDGCRVCLGYTDLKQTINKFKNMAQSIPKADKNDIFMKAISRIDPLTGILSYSGFVEQAEREMLRSQRYGNPLSLSIVALRPTGDDIAFKENELDPCISYVAEILCRNIRKTDIIGRCSDSSFAILFTETKIEEAKEAVHKLTELSEADDYLNYQVYSACTSLNKGDIHKILKNTLEKVTREKAKENKNNTDKNDNEKEEQQNAKLGKYKISDILGFNKKGKNHF